MSGFRSWIVVLFTFRAVEAVSGFRSWLLREAVLEPQDIAGGLTTMSAGVMAADAPDEPCAFKQGEMLVQRRDRHLRVLGQPGLCRETAEIRVVPVAKEPEHDLGGGFQPALLDSPDSRLVVSPPMSSRPDTRRFCRWCWNPKGSRWGKP